jgi:hypothetical protein
MFKTKYNTEINFKITPRLQSFHTRDNINTRDKLGNAVSVHDINVDSRII